MSTPKTPLLFLCHRIPYPPNKGDKIRSWHLLKHLAKRHNIYLATFIDDPADWQHTPKLEEICKSCCFKAIHPVRARIKSLLGFLTGKPLNLHYYRNRSMQRWVRQAVKDHSIKDVVVYSSAMAQFVIHCNQRFHQTIIDFVDVDSEKWRQYALEKKGLAKYVYRREGEKLLAYDRQIASSFDHSVFVSEQEAELFRKLAPESADKISHYYNGVDAEYFDPELNFSNPYPDDKLPMVFTGAMDYWPNINAVCWFAEKVFPQIRRTHPEAVFYIVGGNPDRKVVLLAKREGVYVTGRVADVRPYIQHAQVAVAPMQIARGIQNKVLEAMAMKKTVVVTPQGLEGINAIHGEELLVAETAESFATATVAAIPQKTAIGENARHKVLSKFDWNNNLSRLDCWIEEKTVSTNGQLPAQQLA